MLDNRDLKRGDTNRANACMLLVNKNSKSANDDDYKNILNALSIKKSVYDINTGGKDDDKSNARIIMQLIKPESKILYYKSLNLSPLADQLIIVEEIKMNMLAKSCFAPGLITMMSNLVASQGDIDGSEFAEDWHREYSLGMGHEIYRVKIEELDYQSSLTFRDVAEIGHSCFGAIVFALEVQAKGEDGEIRSAVRLNPINFEFIDWHVFSFYLFMICEDESVSKQVQRLEMPDDKYERLVGRPRQPVAKLMHLRGLP